MKLTGDNHIVEAFDNLFTNIPEQDKLDNEAKLLMFRFLEIVERKQKELGWSRKQLAEKVGTSASYITQLFRGDKLINMLTLAKMKKVLGFEFDIKEKITYQEQVKNYLPIADGKGVWMYKQFTSPNYGETIPAMPNKEELVA